MRRMSGSSYVLKTQDTSMGFLTRMTEGTLQSYEKLVSSQCVGYLALLVNHGRSRHLCLNELIHQVSLVLMTLGLRC